MGLAFIYAGQGSQFEGMGKELYNSNKIFKDVYDEIDIENKIKNISFNSSIEELSKTENTQPAMVLFAIAMTEVLKSEGIIPEMVAGLSLGEYSALYAAGVFGKKQAIDLVSFRGNAMANACKDIECGMSAVLGLDRESLKDACSKSKELGVCEIANYNCPGQLIISGNKEAVEKAGEYAKENGAKRVIPLNVSGPFHTSLMKNAGDKLRDLFLGESFSKIQIPVVFNTTANILQENENIKELLEKQVQSSVYFEDSIRYMIASGIDTFLEIGPGKVLSGFIKKISRDVKIYQVQDLQSLEKCIEILKGVEV